MNRFILPFVTASALICGVFLPKEVAAQTTAKDLVGTWTLVGSGTALDVLKRAK